MTKGIVAKHLLLVLFGITILSCDTGKESFLVRHYYNNGKLREEIEMSYDSVPNGNWTLYFLSGVMKSRFSYVDGITNGTAELYYPSGNLQESGSYYDKKRIGKVLFYYDLPNKPLVAESNYVNVGGKEFPNDAIQYDTAGNIIARTPQVSFDQKQDSLLIKMTYPELRKMRVIIGGFDSLYVVRDEKSLDTVLARQDLSACIVLKDKYRAGDVIRGVVQNYEAANVSGNKGYRKRVRSYYFTHRFR